MDYAFKRVFGSESNRDVLVDLLNAVLQFGPGREVVEVELLNPFNEKEFADDKLSIVDVKARDGTGRVFVVEMQMISRPDHRQRVLYYAARLYSQQLVEGENYQTLRPVFVISFVDSRVFPESSAFHTRFVMHDATSGLAFTDDLALHMIELPKFLTASAALSGRFEAWCYFLRHADALDTDSLPEPLNVPPIRKAMETLAVISEMEREREQYEARWKKKLDDASLAAAYAKKDAYYAEREAEYARREAEYARIEEESRRVKEEHQRAQEERQRIEEENQRIEEENQRIEEENRRAAEQLHSQRRALVENQQRFVDQLQSAADSAGDPAIKADLLRRRDEELARLETLKKDLLGAP